ncbi:hypothetical protein AGMMS49921_13700 [Endomicrobiia bacterium]|nr:hypothetical protein AGMMS49921_13700 [Endomicrobiia bacterium]
MVIISDCANIVKVFGGSPVTTHARKEAADMTSIADAVIINVGTLDNNILEAMQQAMSAANQKGIPIVIDAVGVRG